MRRFLPRRLLWEPWGVALSGVLLIWNSSEHLWLLLSAALIHEAGHFLCAGLLGQEVACLRIGLMGARMELADPLESYPREAAVAASGALANVLAAVVSLAAIRGGGGERMLFFFCSNLFLGFLNLLPARGLDGGVILYALVAQVRDSEAAYGALRLATLASLVFCAAGSLWLLRITGKNLSVLVLCLGLLLRLIPWKTEKRPQ